MTRNDRSHFSAYALAEVDVDPKLVAAFAAWLTDLAARAVSASPRAVVPEWVGTTAELLYDWAEEIPWANGQARGGGQSGTPRAGGLAVSSLGTCSLNTCSRPQALPPLARP
jgi:hypothetical protein